jgi:glycopeptide antibiotics resistance protein
MYRNRPLYFLLILITIAVGLFSRSGYVPEPITPYAGDILYTTMYFFVIGWLFPTMSARKVAALSILLCFGIEVLQLYQADWIEKIRAYKLGGLILGHGFLWSDLLCYSIGGCLGWMVEEAIQRREVVVER